MLSELVDISTSVIEISHVYKRFRIGDFSISIFQDINFSCNKNEFIIFTGPSGSGKSTLLSIIGGLMRVDSGICKVFDHDLTTQDEEFLAIFRSLYVGFVFQTGHLIDSLTIYENILLPAELAQRDNEEIKKRAWELLTEFKLDERAHSLPIVVSGGEYQRAAFIRSLILDPDLLLIDEPTSNQDQQTTEIIISNLTSLKGKKTILVVTHDRKLFPLADIIYIPQRDSLKIFKEE